MKATSISNDNNSNKTELQDDISRLPRDCLMTVLKLTSPTPKDACRFAAVCTTLQSVADSDDVWESFLPVDLSSILCRAEIYVRDLPVSKKKLYLHLCHNWISFYGGTKERQRHTRGFSQLLNVSMTVQVAMYVHFTLWISGNKNLRLEKMDGGRLS
ncbi:hypothetical protein FCM35_KLT06541 [Carex littledalei]|uniref:F-box domain-containing protein n=1 Tax=Carex littledalei TaxID=544730 RepID=A0A833QKE7_9POAL|nr:hypothetical protein FCM35_KLT06541 [Carex littledalei]